MRKAEEHSRRRLRIGIPSVHSRLHPKVMGILGLPPYDQPQRLAFYTNSVVLIFLRGWDLAPMVESSRLDLAFCGIDTIEEFESDVVVDRHFEEIRSPIGLCKKTDVDLGGRNRLVVATEYPGLTRKFLNGRFDNLEILHVHGATEAFPHLDKIDAIVDIVETGETLGSNSLHLIETFSYTYPCIVHNKSISQGELPSLQDLKILIEEALATAQ